MVEKEMTQFRIFGKYEIMNNDINNNHRKFVVI
jgi:hypothetical protein